MDLDQQDLAKRKEERRDSLKVISKIMLVLFALSLLAEYVAPGSTMLMLVVLSAGYLFARL